MNVVNLLPDKPAAPQMKVVLAILPELPMPIVSLCQPIANRLPALLLCDIIYLPVDKPSEARYLIHSHARVEGLLLPETYFPGG